MNIKEEIFNEITNVDLGIGLYDTCLRSTKNIDDKTRRKYLFELAKEGKIFLKITPQNKKYEELPLIITGYKRF